LRRSYLRNALSSLPEGARLSEADIEFLALETRTSTTNVKEILHVLRGKSG